MIPSKHSTSTLVLMNRLQFEKSLQNIAGFGIVLVNYNGWDDTIECLESIERCDPKPEVVVVDNASVEDRSTEILGRFPNTRWVTSRDNTGWSGGNNLGIRFFLDRDNCPDVIFLLNNDTRVSEDIVRVLSAGLDKGYDIVGPVINEYFEPDVIQTQGTAFNRKDQSLDFFSVITTPIDSDHITVTPVDIVNGCAVAIRREVFDRIGLIDERFFLICEESDFCLRAIEAGFRCGVVHRSLVWHKHSVSFGRAGKPIQRYYAIRNLWLLIRQHAGGSLRRNWLSSVLLYWRHSFYVYSRELELVNRDGARAVCDGIADAILGRYGKWKERYNWLGGILNSLMHFVWRIRGGRR